MSGSWGLLPPAASSLAAGFDRLFLCLLLVTGLLAASAVVTMLFFCFRYRRGANADRTRHNTSALRFAWTAVPFALVLAAFGWAAVLYAGSTVQAASATTIYAVAKQWTWRLQHPGGRAEINELHVPVGRPVRLVLASQDIVHSFSVPAFRIQRDALPGRYTSLSFTPTRTGEFPLFCAEYCGTEHPGMRGRIVVMEPRAYQLWLEEGKAPGGNDAAARERRQ